jgi:hypothetical protein
VTHNAKAINQNPISNAHNPRLVGSLRYERFFIKTNYWSFQSADHPDPGKLGFAFLVGAFSCQLLPAKELHYPPIQPLVLEKREPEVPGIRG